MSEKEITREEVAPLLDRVPFRERIDYLLDNQDLGSRKLTTLGDGPFNKFHVYPNCFGTALFVLGAEREYISKLNPKNTSDGMIASISRVGDFAVFPRGFDRPGSLQDDYMKIFLSGCQKVDLLQAGDITYEEGFIAEQDREYHHSMVFLGRLDERNYFFQQNGLRGRFGFQSIVQFEQVPAIPKEELKKDAVLAWDSHFWKHGPVNVREFYRYNSTR
ncbi:MAG: hypothetical protein AABX35_04110 [Nanoarchaeota archaeon]